MAVYEVTMVLLRGLERKAGEQVSLSPSPCASLTLPFLLHSPSLPAGGPTSEDIPAKHHVCGLRDCHSGSFRAMLYCPGRKGQPPPSPGFIEVEWIYNIV